MDSKKFFSIKFIKETENFLIYEVTENTQVTRNEPDFVILPSSFYTINGDERHQISGNRDPFIVNILKAKLSDGKTGDSPVTIKFSIYSIGDSEKDYFVDGNAFSYILPASAESISECNKKSSTSTDSTLSWIKIISIFLLFIVMIISIYIIVKYIDLYEIKSSFDRFVESPISSFKRG